MGEFPLFFSPLPPPPPPPHPSLFNSDGMGVGGLNVAIAFEASAQGLSAEEIVKVLHREQDQYRYVTCQVSIKGLLRSGRVPVVKCTDQYVCLVGRESDVFETDNLDPSFRFILPLASALELKVIGYMPYPVAEAKKHPELIQRAKAGGFEWMTAPVKHGIAGMSWSVSWS